METCPAQGADAESSSVQPIDPSGPKNRGALNRSTPSRDPRLQSGRDESPRKPLSGTRHRPEEVSAELRRARLQGAAKTFNATHHPRLPRPAASARATPCRRRAYAPAKRERLGWEASAFTLNRSARQIRARPSVSRGLRPLVGSRASEMRSRSQALKNAQPAE